MLEQMDNCEGSMTTCDTPLLFPLVLTQVNKVEQQVEKTVLTIHEASSTQLPEQYFYQSELDQTIAPEPPPSFLIPLLI